MIHKSIQCQDIGLSFSHKVCFEHFSADIPYGSRIAIIGDNGSGKSTLLKIVLNQFTAFDGKLIVPSDLQLGYVPQIIDSDADLSGGERFNQKLTEVWA